MVLVIDAQGPARGPRCLPRRSGSPEHRCSCPCGGRGQGAHEPPTPRGGHLRGVCPRVCRTGNFQRREVAPCHGVAADFWRHREEPMHIRMTQSGTHAEAGLSSRAGMARRSSRSHWRLPMLPPATSERADWTRCRRVAAGTPQGTLGGGGAPGQLPKSAHVGVPSARGQVAPSGP